MIGCIKHNGTRCTMKSEQTMDDKAWIREDTLTMQLAIPPDYTFTTGTHIRMRWHKVTGATGWQKMSERARTAQHCRLYEGGLTR